MNKVLVIDDEKSVTEMLEIALKREKYEIVSTNNGVEALKRLKENIFDVIICDIQMPDLNGVQILKESKKLSPETVFILITAYASAETAIEALQYGAYDYITKPFNIEELKHILRRALERRNLKQEVDLLKKEVLKNNVLIGKSPKMVEVCQLIFTIAPTDSTVLIMGESGTGKELIARAIHDGSLRKDKPFVSVNCGAFPETLLESELFGYMKGAFTGADSNKKGLFEVSDHGTIFLDEIGEMSPTMQVKLLRVLQEKQLRRVGGTEEIPIDVRIIAATNQDLKEMVREKKFREDLYYRLAVITINLPPLRERLEDLPLLTNYFLQKYSKKLNKSTYMLSEQALSYLKLYSWPGNVRELENVIERAVTLEPTNEIQSERLPDYVRGGNNTLMEEEPVLPYEGIDLERFIEDKERNLILQALQRTHWNQVEAAKLLRIPYRSLRHKIKLYDIRKQQWEV